MQQSYPIRRSPAASRRSLPNAVTLPSPGRKIQRDLPGLKDGDELARLELLDVDTAATEKELRKRHPVGERIEDPVGRNPCVRILLELEYEVMVLGRIGEDLDHQQNFARMDR
jgi:hypothetical protein